MNQFDQLHRYLFEKASVRGELVRLQDALKPIVHSTDYPQPIQQLLAEMAAATSLLTATLKFEGEVGLQIQSQGKVRYAVINATHEQQLRGVARWDEDADLSQATFSELVENAVLVITITPDEGERYQGVVALDKGSLAGCLEDYFERSEQLATRVFIHTDFSDNALPKASGMFLQVVPQSAESTKVTSDSEFEHLCALTETMTAVHFVFPQHVDDLTLISHPHFFKAFALRLKFIAVFVASNECDIHSVGQFIHAFVIKTRVFWIIKRRPGLKQRFVTKYKHRQRIFLPGDIISTIHLTIFCHF